MVEPMHYRTIVLCLFLVCTLFFPIRGQKDPEDPEHADDQPFGEMTEKDLDRFLAFATSHNVDIYIESEKANHGDKDALAKIFGLASHFKKMDAVTRVYGNLIFASVLNIIESHGEKFFVSGLESHSDLVKQYFHRSTSLEKTMPFLTERLTRLHLTACGTLASG
jgi:hypothetical protein